MNAVQNFIDRQNCADALYFHSLRNRKESIVELFRMVWDDLTPQVEVCLTFDNPCKLPLCELETNRHKSIRLNPWRFVHNGLQIVVYAARVRLENDVIVIQQFSDGNRVCAYKLED